VPIIESLREWGAAFRTKRARTGRPG